MLVGSKESSASNTGSRATIKDVAQLAGVHPSTVSRVLNGDDRRAVAETREKIHDAAKSLGWRPNSFARSLSLGRAYSIGMMIPTFVNPAYTSMIAGAQRAAEDQGNVLFVTDTSDDDEHMRLQLDRMSDRVDGFVVASASLASSAIPLLVERNIPFVLLNRRTHGGHPSVIADDERGVELALSHLYELGHRSIAYVAGPKGIDTVERRLHAYETFMEQHNLPRSRSLMYRGALTAAGIDSGIQRLLDPAQKVRPTALFAVNLLAAAQALTSVKALGLRVPEDLSVVGFDDWPLADHLWVPLTTVRMPSEAMGRLAVSTLLSLLDGKDVLTESLVEEEPELVLRASTCSPPSAKSAARARGSKS